MNGEEIANFCTRAHFNRELLETRGRRNERSEESAKYDSQVVPFGFGELTRQDAYESCWAFVHELSIEQAITDPDPLVQSLAVIDSRMGKRRLAMLNESELHPLAKRLLHARIKAEASLAGPRD